MKRLLVGAIAASALAGHTGALAAYPVCAVAPSVGEATLAGSGVAASGFGAIEFYSLPGVPGVSPPPQVAGAYNLVGQNLEYHLYGALTALGDQLTQVSVPPASSVNSAIFNGAQDVTIENFVGQVVIEDYSSYSCVNSQNLLMTYPYYRFHLQSAVQNDATQVLGNQALGYSIHIKPNRS